MQLSISFVALSVLSLCAASAVPEVTPTAPAVGPGPTDASLPVVPEYLVAEYLASLNSTTTALEKRNVHCETSGGSPFTRDVADAINSFNGVDKCQQTNPGGSFCTTMGCRGSACVGVCGPFLLSSSCQEAHNGLFDTLNNSLPTRPIARGILTHPPRIEHGFRVPTVDTNNMERIFSPPFNRVKFPFLFVYPAGKSLPTAAGELQTQTVTKSVA
ncbi:hypothetical protein C8J57DRAFT_1250459 [Mycena rebaudengoi]|nr:hypothetical protein C8J57DRAFT_1250459 [Mycena rebaudengoi]